VPDSATKRLRPNVVTAPLTGGPGRPANRRSTKMRHKGGASLPRVAASSEERVVVPPNKALIRTGLEALYFTASHLALRPFFGGIGGLLTLHHVRPALPGAFQPNRLLEVTPEFLEKVVAWLRRVNVELISLDEMHRRLAERIFWRKFVCFTFDDGYRDNLEHAYPVLKRHGVPFGIYIPTSFPDRLGELWWLALEAAIARNERVSLELG